MSVIPGLVTPQEDDGEVPGKDMSTFFRTLSIEDAREHLASYTVEEIRILWESGAFGSSPIKEGVKQYMTQRIICGDRLE